MGMDNRMEITKEALKLFIKSLPIGSAFAILSFGSAPEFEFKNETNSKDQNPIWLYNDSNQNEILKRINHFDSDLGGTEILDPLILCSGLDTPNREKRVFLLTDGEVDNRDQIFEYVREQNNIMRIHTFGIGSGCDKELIQKTA